MGVLNMTPDSFADDEALVAGSQVDHEGGIGRGLEMVDAGADIVDVGGESTRPGSEAISVGEELARVIPVIEELARRGVVVSVDTSKPDVAAAALDVGAEIVNDVTALADPTMAELCAATGCGVVLMHMQGSPHAVAEQPSYDDVILDVAYQLRDAAAGAAAAGVDANRICLDPGIGFGKTWTHNLQLLRAVDRLALLGFPLLVGASRKGFLGGILEAAGHPAPAPRRDAATLATVALAIGSGAAVVRVHDVPGGLQAARTADAIVRARIPAE